MITSSKRQKYKDILKVVNDLVTWQGSEPHLFRLANVSNLGEAVKLDWMETSNWKTVEYIFVLPQKYSRYLDISTSQ